MARYFSSLEYFLNKKLTILVSVNSRLKRYSSLIFRQICYLGHKYMVCVYIYGYTNNIVLSSNNYFSINLTMTGRECETTRRRLPTAAFM